MTPVFKVNKGNDNSIDVCGFSQDINLYQSESLNVVSYDRYKYSECYSLNVLVKETTDDEVVMGSDISCHATSIDLSHFDLDDDGIYHVYHIIVPSEEWLQDRIDDNNNFLDKYDIIYFSDGEYLYKYQDEEYVTCEAEELIQINSNLDTTLFTATTSIFSTYNLYQCYINTCMNLLSADDKCGCHSNSSASNSLTYNRDLIWMALNVIEYLIKRDELQEAKNIIEDLMSCNGLCPKNSNTNNTSCGCGK